MHIDPCFIEVGIYNGGLYCKIILLIVMQGSIKKTKYEDKIPPIEYSA